MYMDLRADWVITRTEHGVGPNGYRGVKVEPQDRDITNAPKVKKNKSYQSSLSKGGGVEVTLGRGLIT